LYSTQGKEIKVGDVSSFLKCPARKNDIGVSETMVVYIDGLLIIDFYKDVK